MDAYCDRCGRERDEDKKIWYCNKCRNKYICKKQSIKGYYCYKCLAYFNHTIRGRCKVEKAKEALKRKAKILK